MNKKKQFLETVRILAPGDGLMLNTARLVAEKSIPAFPGSAALEFVTVMDRLRPLLTGCLPRHHRSRITNGSPKRTQMSCQAASNRRALRKGLPLVDAMRIKSAEYWLGLGQPVEAIMELDKVSEGCKKHSWFLKAQVSAVGALRRMNEHATAC